MRTVHRIMVGFLALLVLNVTSAGEKPDYEVVSKRTESIARRYLQAYLQRDWDELAPMLADQARFADTTATLVFGDIDKQGRSAMLAMFREGYAAIESESFRLQRAIFSGEQAIFEGELDWSVRLRSGKLVVVKSMPFIVMLRVVDAKVVEHRDFADYCPYLEARRLVDTRP